jgi:hypothetical protein
MTLQFTKYHIVTKVNSSVFIDTLKELLTRFINIPIDGQIN